MKREEEEDKPLRNVADRTVLVGLHSENGGDGLVVGDTTGSVCSIWEEVGDEGVLWKSGNEGGEKRGRRGQKGDSVSSVRRRENKKEKQENVVRDWPPRTTTICEK
jgi:hypothetical protein